ncbi:MAG: UDP-N-acetylglucosamine 2-epimerase (non-hydrolyzing) [Candidatus Zixiibacteriota bacterium]|nr:MAG: UDP-N-acetylglucosamine 2-epimerase (non-hydrolyzing) [candidate division Zixibacteria bacterium]
MKAAPLMDRLQQEPDRFDTILIHTGQHYDHNLSQLFFDQLGMPEPDSYLGVGSGTHAHQTARIMVELEKELMRLKPDLVIVFGDVNSTLAASVVCAKLCLKLAHVEAGLRSFDNTMPEEINRIVTDRLSDYLFATEDAGLVNLRNEGVPDRKVFFTGNIMIDSLVNHLKAARESRILEKLSLEPRNYVAMTMHRPANVDDSETLSRLIKCVADISERIPVVFPCHPRTAKRIKEFGILDGNSHPGLTIEQPLGYLDFLKLQAESKIVLTDSGGIQEETTYLGIPCITMRTTTELVATVEVGTNTLCGSDPQKISAAVDRILEGGGTEGRIPDLWDGNTSSRIVEILRQKLL